jgi:hypothetical protein
MTSKTQETKVNGDKWEDVTPKSFCIAKEISRFGGRKKERK